jgi:epoxyqueuosine reductase
MGTCVHGCDACQEACPRNSRKLKAKYPEDPFLVKLAEEFSFGKEALFVIGSTLFW